MAGLLRMIGLVNAAIWFGASVFFTFFAGPAFFTDEMLRLLSRPYAGAAAQIVLERYFLLHIWCATIGLAHLIAEWLYSGRPFHRLVLALLMTLFTLSVIGNYVMLPKMKELHVRIYASQSSPPVRQSAQRSFSILHGTSMAGNLLVMLGVLTYFWQTSRPPTNTRFASVNRFKS